MSDPQKRTPPDEPNSLKDLLWYIQEYGDVIYVRECVDGKWKALSLDELMPEAWANNVAGFIEEGFTPVRLLRDEEIQQQVDRLTND